jgi:antitoxin component YwqK of YwqJK toxin-antitoxin module
VDTSISAAAGCPQGARLYEIKEEAAGDVGARVTRYCRDAAGLAHGPWRVYSLSPEADPAIPLAEGSYVHGSPDGVFLYRFEWATFSAQVKANIMPPLPEGDGIQLRQEYKQGLYHGLWRESWPDGYVFAEQHYRFGRRCGAWLYHEDQQGGWLPQRPNFTPCDEIEEPAPEQRPVIARPARGASWDGVRCPDGERIEQGHAIFCARDGRRIGPSLERDGEVEIVGSWADGAPHGRFIAFVRGGALRAWSYKAGALDGPFERWHLATGQLAERGAYVAGELDGAWELRSGLGHLVEDGRYEAGLRDGLFRRLVPSGQVVEAITWAQGLRAGEAKTYYDDGAPECTGSYEADLRQGPWRCLHPTGAVRVEGPYERGVRHGMFRRETLDGELFAEGAYERGDLEGTWRTYFEADVLAALEPESAGRIVSLTTYERGVPRGEQVSRWLKDDKLHSRVPYRDGRRNGLSQEWYHSGQLFSEGPIIDGAQHDVWRAYYPSGQLALELTYDLGTLHGPYVEYDQQGAVTRRGIYEYGRFIAQAGL